MDKKRKYVLIEEVTTMGDFFFGWFVFSSIALFLLFIIVVIPFLIVLYSVPVSELVQSDFVAMLPFSLAVLFLNSLMVGFVLALFLSPTTKKEKIIEPKEVEK